MPKTDCPCECVSVSSLVLRARSVLNDDVRSCGATTQQFAHWSDVDLAEYLTDGLALLSSLRPDAFVVVEEIALAAGSRQEIPKEYDSLVAVVSNVSDEGDGPAVVPTDDTYTHVAPSQCDSGDCAADGTAEVRSFSTFPQSQRHFTVAPPVPAGQEPRVVARLVKAAPCVLALDDCVPVAIKFHPALVNWVLHRAFAKDIESAFATAMSDRYYRWFFDTLEAQRLAEARFRSGYYLGMVGDEDGQLRNR